ncbi:MAG TPA: VWA domain-containing protein [Vicinamibacterales bacterium]|nr:VWA domain-containing protein [Vicinamibacterales bacterium]
MPSLRLGATLTLLVVAALGSIARPAAQAAPQTPTFRSAVTLVTTDVIPRDSAGRFIPDLTRENFTVLEDGVAQSISSFALVHGGRTFNTIEAPPTVAPEGIILPTAPRRLVGDATGRVLLIIIDDLHFEPEYSPHVRRLVQTIVDTVLHEGDAIAMVSSGPSSIEIPLTYDRKLIAASASKIRGSAMTAGEMFKLLETSQGPGDVRQRAQIAFYSAYSVLADLERVQNKRKAILYISTGYDFDPFAASRASRDRIQGGRYGDPTAKSFDEENPYFRLPAVTAGSDLHALMRELTLSANRANATIFTIDPRGLAGIVDAGQQLDQSEWRTYLQKSQSSLRYLAEETGGFAVVNDNDFESALKRIDAETSDYYVLGYYSSNPDPAQRVRALEVKVDRPGITVASRRAYSLKTPGVPSRPKRK